MVRIAVTKTAATWVAGKRGSAPFRFPWCTDVYKGAKRQQQEATLDRDIEDDQASGQRMKKLIIPIQ